MHLHLAPFSFSSYIFITPIWYVIYRLIDCLICCTIIYTHQCLSLVLWSTKVLTEGLPLLFGIPFSIVIFLTLLFSCGHFLLGFSHHRATMQRLWRSLRSLRALVSYCYIRYSVQSIWRVHHYVDLVALIFDLLTVLVLSCGTFYICSITNWLIASQRRWE